MANTFTIASMSSQDDHEMMVKKLNFNFKNMLDADIVAYNGRSPGNFWKDIQQKYMSGGGTGAVTSVNGKTGVVVLDSTDVGAVGEAYVDAADAQLSSRISTLEGAGYQTSAQVESRITSKGYQTSAQVDSKVATAKAEIEAEIPTVPTNVSAFANDAGYLTQHQSLAAYRTSAAQDAIDAGKQDVISDLDDIRDGAELGASAVQPEAGKGLFSGDYNDLTNKPTIPTVPTNVSAFTNDAGYLTQHQSLANYDTKAQVDSKIAAAKTEIEAEIPTVPTNVSAFTNDAGYLTQHQSLANYDTKAQVNSKIAAAKSEIEAEIPTVPTNVSAFTNDAGYLTQHQDISGKQDKLVSGTNIKTVNSQSLLGSGNIEIGGGATSWDDITDKPATFPPSSHAHAMSDVTGLQYALDAKADDGDIPTKTSDLTNDSGFLTTVGWTDVTGKPATFTPSAHVHSMSDVTGLTSALDGKADTGDIPTKTSDLTNDSGFLTSVGIADVTGLQSALDAKADDGDIPTKTSDLVNDSGFITTVAWGDVTGKPATFAPSAHTHPTSDVTGLGTAATYNVGHAANTIPYCAGALKEKAFTPICTTAGGLLYSRDMIELISTTEVTITPGEIASGGYKTGTTAISRSGWTPIGFVGRHASTRYLHEISMYLTNATDGGGTINWMFHASGAAVAASANTKVNVLWIRS